MSDTHIHRHKGVSGPVVFFCLEITYLQLSFSILLFAHFFLAGKATTDEELEEMLESGNAAVFTAGVSVCLHSGMPLLVFSFIIEFYLYTDILMFRL